MKQKHLTFDDRLMIEDLLRKKYNFTDISKILNKHRTTISKEVILHKTNKSYTTNNNVCKNLLKPPYVCNSCNIKHLCKYNKSYYHAKDADNEYYNNLKKSREGIKISKQEIYEIDNIISPLIKYNKQTVNHVYINHPDLLYFSKPTFYSYINRGLFSCRNIDLPRKVRYKVNKNNYKRRSRIESAIRIGRRYNDFLNYISSHPHASIVEMDTVEGNKGGSVFLTLLFRNCNLMLIYPMIMQSPKYVTRIFNNIKNTLGSSLYSKIFEVILTDNGKEFYDPISIELDNKNGEILSQIFYCDPGASFQKGSIEKNHEFIRYILPKGTSFNNLSIEDCYKISSHINSLCRDSLNKKSPYQTFDFLYGKDILDKLNISYIHPDNVNLSPNLISKK